MNPLRTESARRSARLLSRFQPAVCAAAALGVLLPSLASAGTGGGWTNAGLAGDYFNNTSLTAPASFSRKEQRLDFGNASNLSPGGSISPAYLSVGATNWSAHWTGQVIPRFSEAYTFKVFADDTVVIKLRPAGTSAWTTVINQAAYTGADSTGSMNLTAGQAYDVDIAFTQAGGGWGLRLRWSSASTPEETIDTLTQSGINNPDGAMAFRDIIKGARNSWNGVDGNPAPAMDAQGWPMGNGSYVFQESLNQGLDVDPLMRGKVGFSFKGKADVSIQGNVDGSTLTYSYSSGTNTTTGSFTVKNNGWNASSIFFRNAHRDGAATGPGGVTDLRLMRPAAPDATSSYDPADATVFTPQMKDAMSHFNVIRFQYVANQQKDWSGRTPPDYFNQAGGTRSAPQYGNGDSSDNGWSWEHKIMLANETGRDLMISLPPVASGASISDTSSYLYKLANLIRYGSNGTEPYTSATANPVYPPLNPNLRVYLEFGNELWNWFGVFSVDYNNINAITKADADANNADFQIINYDNLSTAKDGNGNYNSMGTWRYRKIILRMIQTSNLFRSIFGDGAMPGTSINPRVRPLYEWQYANDNATAELALTFADNYFNNSDGVQHVTTARPLSYYLWGGGGAAYYGAVNGNGLTTLLANSGFETPGVGSAYNQAPAGAAWSFSGAAGIAKDTGSSDDVPPPYDGSQMGYVTDTGSMSINVTFPAGQTSNYYAVSFRAVNRTKTGASSADKENVRVYLDDTTDITAKTASQGNGYTPPGYNSGEPWRAQNVWWTWSDYYYCKGFTVAPGSTHKITIKGMGDTSNASNTNQTVFLEDIRITSVDKVFADGIPGGGEATGQPTGQNIQNTMNTEANWAKTYGLQELAYESGWSLGGDDGGSWVQLKAKYGDSRTKGAQIAFMDMFHKAGSAVNVFGTYAQWPSWSDYYAEQGLLNAGLYPIVQGIDDRANNLPAEATNGAAIPATLTLSNATLGYNANKGSGKINAAGGFLTWNLLAPSTGQYNFGSDATTGGALRMEVDGQNIGAIANTKDALTAAPFGVTLTKGFHVLRVLSTSGSFTVTQVFAKSGAPAQSGSAVEVFGFKNQPANSTSASPSSLAPGVTASNVTLGAGLSPNSYGGLPNMSGCFQAGPTANNPATSLADAKTKSAYYTFSVTPSSGKKVSLSRIDYRLSTDDGTHIQSAAAWSADGSTFNDVTTVDAMSGTSNGIRACSADLSGAGGLQNATSTVTFRIYVWGIGNYNSIGLGQTDYNAVVLYGSVADSTSTGPTIQTSASSLTVNEASSNTFTVKLSSAPASNVTVSVARSSGSSNLSVTGGSSLTFTPSNYATAQTVTISSQADDFDATNDTATITCSATGLSSVNVAATQADDDAQTAADLTGSGLTGANIGTSSGGGGTAHGGVWWIDGSGSGLTSTADSFHFEGQGISGDFQVLCQVRNFSSSGTTPRAGVMIRESAAAGARYVMLSTKTAGSGAYSYGSRTTTNGAATETTPTGTGSSYTYPNAWVRLERRGDAVKVSTSPDNATWTDLATVTLSGLSSSVQAGVFSSSGSVNINARAIIAGYRVNSLSSGGGLQAEYFNNMSLSGTAALTRSEGPVDFDWGSGSPASGTINTDGFSARWSGLVIAPITGNVTFTVTADDGVRLWVGNTGGTAAIDRWINQSATSYSYTVAMTAGQAYPIKMEYYENTGGAVAKLHWSYSGQADTAIPQASLQSGSGLSAEYYDNMDFTGAKITRVDAGVNFDWGSGSPDPAIGADTFSARWTGTVTPRYSETYTFWTTSDDGVRLWVNNQLLVDNWTDHGSTDNSGAITLSANTAYSIKMEYYENTGGAVAKLGWSSASQARESIPASQLSPLASTGSIAANTVYELEPQCAPGESLDVSGVSTADGANVQIWQYLSGSNQRWKAIDVGGGWWEFEPQHAIGKRLDVAGSGSADGTNVQILGSNSGSSQRWKVYDIGGGIVELEPQCAPGKRLDVNGSGTVNGTNVQIWTGNSSSAQRWKLIP